MRALVNRLPEVWFDELPASRVTVEDVGSMCWIEHGHQA